MIVAPIPPDEDVRLAEIEAYAILDSLPERTYDAITSLAAQICDTPIALITIVGRDRQWFKSRVGLDIHETSRDVAFCSHAILEPEALMIVPDATRDDRFADNPLVTGNPDIRFYAGAPLVTEKGNAVGTLCVIDRIPRTLTPDQEHALESLAIQVMALLDLRLTVDELQEKQQQLEALTRERQAFIANVSHELRTPLTAVVGFAEMLTDPEADLSEEARAEMLGAVARQAGEVGNLIEDLLVAARAEAGSLTVTLVPVNLTAQVAQVLEGLDPEMAAMVAVEADACAALGDPARIRQVVRNLLTNAFRYGGPNVRVVIGPDGDRSHLRVIDDGPGIPLEEQEAVFEPYTRASNARDVAGSVGLGLPISRLLSERMGGSLTYRRAEEQSVFDLALPAPR